MKFFFFCILIKDKTKIMIEILRKRRSIRKYTDKKIEQSKIELLKEAVLRAPTSKNLNPWEFVFVDDPEIISQLKNCKAQGANPLATAALAVVVCADETINDAWVEDCSIASIILQLTAQSLGLGSCWVHVHNRLYSSKITSEKYIQNLLGMPEKFKVLSIISIGYPAKTRDGKPFEELQFEKIRWNKF